MEGPLGENLAWPWFQGERKLLYHPQAASPSQGPLLPCGKRLCGSTWAVEGIGQPIIVVPLEEGEADVSRAGGWGLPELQR